MAALEGQHHQRLHPDKWAYFFYVDLCGKDLRYVERKRSLRSFVVFFALPKELLRATFKGGSTLRETCLLKCISPLARKRHPKIGLAAVGVEQNFYTYCC